MISFLPSCTLYTIITFYLFMFSCGISLSIQSANLNIKKYFTPFKLSVQISNYRIVRFFEACSDLYGVYSHLYRTTIHQSS